MLWAAAALACLTLSDCLLVSGPPRGVTGQSLQLVTVSQQPTSSSTGTSHLGRLVESRDVVFLVLEAWCSIGKFTAFCRIDSAGTGHYWSAEDFFGFFSIVVKYMLT